MPGLPRFLESPLGGVAEWSCSGLQSRVRRFDSDPRLQTPPSNTLSCVVLVIVGRVARRRAVVHDVFARGPAIQPGAGRDFGVGAELAIEHRAIAAQQIFGAQLAGSCQI